MKRLVCKENPKIYIVVPDENIREVGGNCWQVTGPQPITYSKCFWDLEDMPGHKEYKIMIDTSKEWVLCAAIWYKDGTEAPRGMIAQNISSGVVIGQWRHGNCINVRATNPLWNAKKLAERMGEDSQMITKYEDTLPYFEEVDGFLTSEGRFVDRWQAMKIAYEAGQVDENTAFRTWDLTDEDISDEELMASEPHYRRGPDRGKWRMMYSEDIY